MTEPNHGQSDPKQCEVYGLAEALLGNVITPDETRRLKELLSNDAAARRRYVRFMYQTILLRTWSAAPPPGQAEPPESGARPAADLAPSVPPAIVPQLPLAALGSRTDCDGNAPLGPRTAPAATAGDAPAAHPSSFIVHPFQNSSGYFPSFSGGVVWSYICAALFLGIGVVAARLWDPAGDPTQLVRNAVSAPAQTAASSAPVIVGKVAAMSNCQWLDPQTAAREGEPVARGRSYVLTSGLLQIAYNTGARAIIQGPVVYTVDAPNGGSLSLGKLTVEAGKLDRAAMAASEKARGHPAPPPRAPAFCVRTHTAIVLDKGDQDAKFGVEVDRSVATYTRVFSGTVIFTSPGFEPRSVPAGVCVWTGAGAKRNGLFIFKPGPESLIFATEMPKPPPVCVADPPGKENQRPAGGG